MIFLDYRERKIIPLLLEIDDFVEITNLPVGDILIPVDDQSILIERKSSGDFIDSIKTSRLWDQAGRIRDTDYILNYRIKRKIILIHEQILPSILSERISWASIFGAIQELVYVYNFQVFHVETDFAMKEFLRILIKREIEKKNDAEPKIKWEKRVPYSKDDLSWKLYILSSIPYVGEKTAKKLLDKFGSIERIARATPVELMKIPGIGEEKAKIIYRLLH